LRTWEIALMYAQKPNKQLKRRRKIATISVECRLG